MFRPKQSQTNLAVESIIIPCRNGVSFGGETQIVFDIPRNVNFASLKDARLLATVQLDTNAAAGLLNPAYIPDKDAGVACMIDRINIRSNGVLLEELRDYWLWAKLYNSASSDEGILNKRTRLEGCMKTNRIQDSPYHIQARPNVNGVANVDPIRTVAVRVEIPLLGGIFQKDTVFPLGAMPLEVEIITRKADECFTLCDSGTSITGPGATAGGGVTSFQVAGGEALVWGPLGGANERSSDPNCNQGSCCPLRVGQQVRFTAAAGNANLTPAAIAGTLTIVNITTVAGGGFVVNVSGAIDLAGAAAAPVMHSLAANGALLNARLPSYTLTAPRLIIPKIVPPPQFASAMMQAVVKGQFALDVVSYTNYNTAIPGAVSTSTNIIPADLSRVRSIISVPVDRVGPGSGGVTSLNPLSRICKMGGHLGASNYQFQINNALQPSRSVQLGREAFGGPADAALYYNSKAVPYAYGLGSCLDGPHGYELEKALDSANIPVRNITFITKPAALNGCWAVGRTLGPYNTSTNLMGISSILYLNYDGTNQNLKLLHNYVSHIRTYALSPEGVTVQY